MMNSKWTLKVLYTFLLHAHTHSYCTVHTQWVGQWVIHGSDVTSLGQDQDSL